MAAAPFRITIDGTEYPCDSWKKVEQGRPVSVAWEEGFWNGMGEPRYKTPGRYYVGNLTDTTSPPYVRIWPSYSTLSLSASLNMALPMYIIQGRQADLIPVTYVLNGRLRIKINRTSLATFETDTNVAGLQYGRPALFEGTWRLPVGENGNGMTLTIANNPTLDTEGDLGVPARHLAVIQAESQAQLARADNSNEMYLSADAVTWAGPYEVGESTVPISDLLETQGELMVIKPDGPRKFDSQGVSRPLQKFVGAHPNISGDIGSNSHGHGTFTFWVHPSGVWRIVGDLMIPVNFDADPKFYAFLAADFDLSTQFSSFVAYGRWAYATRGTQLFAAFINDDGTLIWHGSIYDGSFALRVGMDLDPTTGNPALWVAHTGGSVLVVSLQADGSMRAPLGSNRGVVSGATFRLPRWDGGRAERTKQLRRFWLIGEGFAGTDGVTPQVRRDGGSIETIPGGSGLQPAGSLTELVWTPGTNDTFREVELRFGSWDSDGTGDPRLRAFGIEAHTFDVYEAVIPLTPDAVKGFSGGIRGMLKKLRHLESTDLTAFKEPEVNETFNGYVLGVQEQVVGREGNDGVGYQVRVLIERAAVPT